MLQSFWQLEPAVLRLHTQASRTGQATGGFHQVAPGKNEKKKFLRDETRKPLRVFAEKSFYLGRPEPEELLIGVFQLAPVQEGPNTRDMPFKLVVGTDTLRVYVAGFNIETLSAYIGHEVKVVGKRIDQSNEGYGIEIWIATITLSR